MRPPVRFVLDGPHWSRGYDRAMQLSDEQAPEDMVNPFDDDEDAWIAFEEGRIESVRLRDHANA